MSIKQTLRELIVGFFWTLGGALFINWLFFQLCQVPTCSMEPTIMPGDVLVVSKLHYGARTPQTPLHVPFMQGEIWPTGLPSYLTWLQLPVYRLPGFSKVCRGDCVVFSPPRAAGSEEVPQDMRISYVKRCVGLPGDKVSLVDTDLLVGGKPLTYNKLQHCYEVIAQRRLPDNFFAKYGIGSYMHLPEGGAYVHTTKEVVQALKALPAIDNVVPVIKRIGDPTRAGFAHGLRGNEDQLPQVSVPKKGMQVAVGKKMLACYGHLIHYHEGHKKVAMAKGRLWINGNLQKTYTFRKDYYFMVGDNRHESSDSRFWGFVPQDHIVGKAVLILASGKCPNKHLLYNLFTFNIRWGRLLRRI